MRATLHREAMACVVVAGILALGPVAGCGTETDAPQDGPTGMSASALVGPFVTVQNYDGTPEGTLIGLYDGYAYNYLGVPYAAPPVGQLRLAPPAKVTAWSGNRAASYQSFMCPQGSVNTHGTTIGSEDCLYLNVWTTPSANPATPNLPVLVFHHGGGGVFGGTSAVGDGQGQGFYDGALLARAQNAIVVSIQSRLGALGYLADPALSANTTSRTSAVGGGTSGNYGLLDTIQALKWVKRNIAQFGGDPAHVMYFGQSGGATNACMMLASPLAIDPADGKPYFSSVIMQSGFCEEPTLGARYTQATTQMATLGCASAPDKVTCLRSAPLQKFVDVGGTLTEMFPNIISGGTSSEVAFGLHLGPNVDGYVVPDQPRRIFSNPADNNHPKVPVIVGSTKDEISTFMMLMKDGVLFGDSTHTGLVPSTCASYTARVTTNLGATLGAAALAAYPCNPADPLSPMLQYSQAITHLQYECPARRTLRALAQGQTQPVRRYWFTHAGDNNGLFHNLNGMEPWIGAFHTAEIPFIFNTHNTMFYVPSTREQNLGTALQKYWRAFAAAGDPNYTGGTNWPAYVASQDNALKLEVTGKSGPSDPGIQTVLGVDTTFCDFWDPNFTLDGWY